MAVFDHTALKRLRVSAGYPSQGSLARRLGVSRQCVNDWETGLKVPGGELLYELTLALHCKIEALFVTDLQDHDSATRPPVFTQQLQ